MKRGQLVVVDSPEGAGKTTLLAEVQKKVLAGPLSNRIIFTREPGGTELAEEIRRVMFGPLGKTANAQTLLSLFWAARADHIEKKISPALMDGVHVISDRFDSSTFAYQIWGYENYNLVSTFNHMREVVMRGLVPFYVFLDVDPVVGLARKSSTSDRNFIDDKPVEFHQRVYKGFGEFFAKFPNTNTRIDASQLPEKVLEDFLKALDVILIGGRPKQL